MNSEILFSQLNDFIYCPVSIYFHNLYGIQAKDTYCSPCQILGDEVHKTVDTGTYTSNSKILQGLPCYCEKYNLIGKIDLFDAIKGILTERKKFIKEVYDGYVFQLYAQYFSLKEMGYKISRIRLYSYDDNKVYKINLPEEDPIMFKKFEKLIYDIKNFRFDGFLQTNKKKCLNCIYEPACDRSLL